MKKISIIISLMVSLLFFVALAQASPIGKITGITGNADITPAGENQAKKLAAGDTVSTGDIVRTKSKSKAEIAFNDGNILRLAENTRLKIAEYMSGRDKKVSIISLLRGKIQNTVNTVGGEGGRYEVHTPTSVCGVRGTVFFNYHLNGVSGSLFEKGEGYGFNARMPQDIKTISAGHKMIVPGASEPAQLRPFTPGELKALQMETDPSSGVFRSEESAGNAGRRLDQTLDQYKPVPGDVKPYIPPPVHHEPHPPYPPQPPYPY
ncbi:MAG: FecR family protein [Deltaproteobacteria bacterium]